MKLNINFGNQNPIYKITYKLHGNNYIIQEPQFDKIESQEPRVKESKGNLSAFGKKIRDYRQQKGVSIVEVAKAIGIDRSYLSKLENGHEPITISILNKLISHFIISKKEAQNLAILAGFAGNGLIVLDQ